VGGERVTRDGHASAGDFEKAVASIKEIAKGAPNGACFEAMLQLAREANAREFWEVICAHSPSINVEGAASEEAEDLCANDPDRVADKMVGDWKHRVDLRRPASKEADRSPCRRALDLVYGDRQRDYGHPADNWGRIARYWSAYLFNRFGISVLVEPRDVGWMNILQKIARDNEQELAENIDDTAGYAEGMHLVAERDASQTSETYPAEAQETQTCST